MGIAIVALLAFGGSFAYFTATTNVHTGTITTGTVKLDSNGTVTITTSSSIFPSSTTKIIDGGYELVVDTDDANGNYVAVVFSVSVSGTKANNDPVTLSDLGLSGLVVDGTTWELATGYTDMYVLKADDGIAEDGDTLTVISGDVIFNQNDNWAEGESHSTNGLMGAEITITLKAASIQSYGIANQAAANAQLATKLSATPST